MEQSPLSEADSYSDNKVLLCMEHGNCTLFTTANIPYPEPVESRPHCHILFFKIYFNIILGSKYNRTPNCSN
jgi:hypothetical protein